MWFLCMRRNIRTREQWTTTLDEHLAWMEQRHQAGQIYLSGPGWDEEGTFYGIYLIRTASRDEAEQVAASDPFTASGDCAYALIEWEVHQIMGAGAFSTAALAQLREDRSGS